MKVHEIILGEGADVLAQQPREVGKYISPVQQAQSREGVTTIKLIEANLQHGKAASYTISRRFANELLDEALIQESWTTGPGRINGLENIPDFCFEDVVAAQLTVPTDEGQLELTVCSAYFAGDIGAENPSTLVKNLVRL
ncbi:hypothetical protein JTB14_010279 [Gonioctena quinquepunctata]|nr:hypothetical protein JTB14_010279 [Gonioctena quinquepunctata]